VNLAGMIKKANMKR